MTDGPARVPVVLIHGAMRSRAGMLPAASYLRRRGLEPRTFGYSTRTRGLEDHARRLATFLDGWLGAAPRPVLGFLTHSMGALVVRTYLAHEGGGHADTFRLVMLSPPNRGSHLARELAGFGPFHWLYGKASHELRSAGALPPPPHNARTLILAGGKGDEHGYNPRIPGDNDGLVAVDEMGLPGVDPVVVGGAHSFLQWRPSVLRRASRFLATGEDG